MYISILDPVMVFCIRYLGYLVMKCFSQCWCRAFKSVFLVLFVFFITFNSNAADLSLVVSADSTVYENNDVVNYQVTITNLSSSTIDDISVSADFMSLISGSDLAFQSTEITGKATWLSNQGDYDSSGDLVVSKAKLRAGGVLTYTVLAKVSDQAKADISVKASVSTLAENIDSNILTVTPVPYEYSVTLSADKSEYGLNESLVYTLTVENTGPYKVQHLSINQLLSSLSVESITGDLISPFSTVTISADKNGIGSHVGDFSTQGDLVVTDAELSVGGSVTYTIVTSVASNLTGDIVTSATSETKDGTVDSLELITPPLEGELIITKHEFENSSPYLVNGEMRVLLSVENTGAGVVHNYHVKHTISELQSALGNNLDQGQFNSTDTVSNPYVSWVPTVLAIGTNSVSALNTSGGMADQAFDDTVSVYPGETIEYELKATVTPATIGVIKGLTAKVFKSNGVLASSSDSITTTVEAEKVLATDDPEIKITKSTSQSQYTPGGEVVYDITVENTSSKYFANNLIVVDKL